METDLWELGQLDGVLAGLEDEQRLLVASQAYQALGLLVDVGYRTIGCQKIIGTNSQNCESG